jgi:hypothetical protein
MEARARVLLAATLVLLVGLVVVPSALAVSATVRVEGTPYQIAPATAVAVPTAGTFVDTDGTSFTFTKANALAALDRAAALRGFTYGFNTSYGAPFLEMVAGFTADPADWSDGWTYMVNGVGYPVLDMGAADFVLKKGDRVVFTQNPDATFTRGAKLLRLRFAPGRAVAPGEDLTITVLGDDVARANSDAEAIRYGLVIPDLADPDKLIADPSVIERPADFAPVLGATVHVGSRVYVDGAAGDVLDGKIAASDLPKGTYGVWAEMTMDAKYSYVRSGLQRVNVEFGPRVTNVAGSAQLSGGRLVARAAFTLDKRCSVKVSVFNARGQILARMKAGGLGAGRHALVWRGQPAAAVTNLTSFVVKATDAWGRTTQRSIPVRVTR